LQKSLNGRLKMEYKVTMPILSDTMDKGKIIKWYVKEGDFVKKGDKLVEIESDKATMDIESFVSGMVKQILAFILGNFIFVTTNNCIDNF
jgi:biotin carboxyl carrier protein